MVLITKGDLRNVEAGLKSDLENLEARLSGKITLLQWMLGYHYCSRSLAFSLLYSRITLSSLSDKEYLRDTCSSPPWIPACAGMVTGKRLNLYY